MCSGFATINVFLHDTVLVNTDSSKEIECSLVTRINTIENHADDNLLPGWTTFAPKLGFLQVDNVTNVLHDTVKCSCSQNLVFIVVCNGNQKFSVAIVHCWT